MMGGLVFLARHGRMVLVAGLIAGIGLPDLAHFIKQWLWLLVMFLLFMAALRIGFHEAMGKLADLSRTLPLLLLFQLVTPLFIIGLFSVAGFHSPLATAIILSATGCSISGSANLAIMTGNNPAPGLRLLIVGLAVLPLTSIPVFLLLPELGSVLDVLLASLRLLAVIMVSTCAGFWVRHVFLPSPETRELQAMDGASSFLMCVLVIGLMSAIGPVIRHDPALFLTTLAVATLTNFSWQILAFYGLKKWVKRDELVATAIVAGNRNNAVFIAVLPAAVMDPLLLFIGCYQIPMYLTPLVLGRFYRPKNGAKERGRNGTKSLNTKS